MTHPMMRHTVTWIRGTNPVPWRVSTHGADPLLKAYKDDLHDELHRMFPKARPIDDELDIEFYFYRVLEGRRKPADATNLQKATEDALHGILFHDDVQVRKVSTEILEQSKTLDEPAVGISVMLYKERMDPLEPAWLGGTGVWNVPDLHDDDWDAPAVDRFFSTPTTRRP